MQYKITTQVLGSPFLIYIDESEFNQIKEARNNLFKLLSLEENLDLVTENYFDYETTLLSLASRNMVFNELNYFSMGNVRNKIIRNIANLLTSCTMYLDQSAHVIQSIYGANSSIVNLIKREKSTQYDDNFGYRVMEALRDYVQHRGFPIHAVSYPSGLTDFRNLENSNMLYSITPFLNVSVLEEDSKFKKKVLKELLEIKNKDKYGIDIRPLIRVYVECIGKIQEKIREIVKVDLGTWETIIDNVISKYRSEFGKDQSILGLVVVAINEDNRLVEEYAIFKEFIERRQSLENKNRVFINLRKRFVSNEIRKDDD
jgi:hypothetical protein